MADVQHNDRKIKSSKNPKIVKKRSRNPEEWHKQKQKRLRIAGLEYVNANGKVIPPKQPGPDCNCRRKCFERVPEDVRLKTFNGFYSMKSHDEQNAYLFGLMRQVDVKRKRVKKNSRRTCTFEYFIRVRGRETQVCQTAFKNIHSITERKVRVLCKKMDDGVMFPSDNRGKNSHRTPGEVRLPSGIIDQVKNHIYSIVHTHRLKDFIRVDKIAGLEINISKMWKDYVKTYDPENITATMPKSKRTLEMHPLTGENMHPQPPTQTQEISYTPITYTNNGQIVNLGDNCFQSQYQTTALTTTAPSNYYQPQTGQILLQPATTARPTQAAFILLPTKTEPQSNYLSAIIQQTDTNVYDDIKLKKEKKIKKDKKRGPLVKQWRYTNIFHDEINGAALAAIKTRLGMYYAESDAARKKTKPIKPENMVTTQTQTPTLQIINTQHIPPPHTVTIYE